MVDRATSDPNGSPDGETTAPTRRRRVEIVHESLLREWPRLVGWQTQDADGARLREDLRQAARLWEQHDRSEDFLWSGTAFREYEVWRARYPGGLTELEESFGRAMTRLAQRRKRRARLVAGFVFVALLSVLAVVWASRTEALRSARRAEAQKLLALGQLELEGSPTSALAYATKSLELSDSQEGRMAALHALTSGPPARVLPIDSHENGAAHFVSFSPSGDWAVIQGFDKLQVVSRDGATHLTLEPFPTGTGAAIAAFDRSGDYLWAAKDNEVRAWSVPSFDLVERQRAPSGEASLWVTASGVVVENHDRERITLTRHEVGRSFVSIGQHELSDFRTSDVDPEGQWYAFADANSLYVRSLGDWSTPPRLVGEHPDRIDWLAFEPRASKLVARDRGGTVRLWPLEPGPTRPIRELTAFDLRRSTFDPYGRRIALYGRSGEQLRVAWWELDTPLDAEVPGFSATLPSGNTYLNGATFTPAGEWLATGQINSVAFWPANHRPPLTFAASPGTVRHVAFAPDGEHLASVSQEEVRLWSLRPGGSSRLLESTPGLWFVAFDPDGQFVAVARHGGVVLYPLNGGDPRRLEGYAPNTWVSSLAIDGTGRRIAASVNHGPREEKVIRIWDLESGQTTVLGPLESAGEAFDGTTMGLAFLPSGGLASSGDDGLNIWSLENGQVELVAPSWTQTRLVVFQSGRYAAFTQGDDEAGYAVAILDLERRTTRTLPSHDGMLAGFALDVDPGGRFLVTGSGAGPGFLRVGPISGQEPHRLLGHGPLAVDISPDGRRIASAGGDGTVRVWAMPDLTRPPLHTLPHDELIAKLHELTNLRLVKDPDSEIGWKLDYDPFPGWEDVPEW